jgi:hypothetical protein
MSEEGNSLSRNPNVCASCSSLADGMEEAAHSELVSTPANRESSPPEQRQSDLDEIIEVSATQPRETPVEVARRTPG